MQYVANGDTVYNQKVAIYRVNFTVFVMLFTPSL